jgi:metal-sulfur cluster biosynthetic enzyme
MMAMKKKITEKQVMKKLEEVMDPELGINIVDLGLIYGVEIGKDKAKVTMTFTTPACPLAMYLANQVEEKVMSLGFTRENTLVHVTFDPPWTPEKMSKKAKTILEV